MLKGKLVSAANYTIDYIKETAIKFLCNSDYSQLQKLEQSECTTVVQCSEINYLPTSSRLGLLVFTALSNSVVVA